MVIDFSKLNSVVADFLASGLSLCDDASFYESLNSVRGSSSAMLLMEHQIDAVAFLHSRAGGILADDMGLGKTCCAVVRCLVSPEKSFPCLVVTPAGLRNTWRDEILRIDKSLSVSMPNSPADIESSRLPQFVIIPFSRLKAFYKWDAISQFKILYVDEAQAFKNSRGFNRSERQEAAYQHSQGESVKGHRTSLLFEISRDIPAVFCLTGTPVLSRPRELFNLLRLIRHPLAGNFIRFSERFCGGVQTRFGWHADGCTNAVELRESLKNVVLRRLKLDVLQLPGKETILTRTPLSGEWLARYRGAWGNYVSEIRATRSKKDVRNALKAKHLVSLNLLRQICSQSKAEYISARVAASTEKFIIFTSVTETLTNISEKLKSFNVHHVCYHGALNEKKRHLAVQEFRTNPDCRVFVSNTEAGKTGLTLVEATRVVFMDMVWTPADHYQAEDRAHRIGQTKKVTCEYLIAPGTVEDVIYELLSSKKKVIDRILGGAQEDDTGEMATTIEGDFIARVISAAKTAEADQLQIF